MRAIAAVPLYLLMITTAHAAEPYLCRNGFFPASAGSIVLATVVAAGSEPLSDEQEGIVCRSRTCAVVHRGDQVLVSASSDGKSCAWHPRRYGDDLGWLPSASLMSVVEGSPRSKDWIGSWTPVNGGATIRIRPADDGKSLHVQGNAKWYGALLASGERVVHFGSFDGKAIPSATMLTVVDESTCEVRMQRVADYLVAADNRACGGFNVNFDGVYRRSRP